MSVYNLSPFYLETIGAFALRRLLCEILCNVEDRTCLKTIEDWSYLILAIAEGFGEHCQREWLLDCPAMFVDEPWGFLPVLLNIPGSSSSLLSQKPFRAIKPPIKSTFGAEFPFSSVEIGGAAS